MAILTPPPGVPNRSDRTTFSSRVDAFLSWLSTIVPQLNVFISSLTTLSAGGANSYSYFFDTTIADSDPGVGKLRLGSSPENISIALRISTTSGSLVDISNVLSILQGGTSNIKATVRLQKLNDPSTWMVLDVSGIAGSGAYRNLTAAVRASSSANPFSNGDSLMVFFDRVGDKGDGGNTPTSQQIRDALGTLPVSNGGTGATTAAQALTNLGALSLAGGTMSGPVSLAKGTIAAPGLSFAADTDTGLYNFGDGVIGLVCNAGQTWLFGNASSTTYRSLYADTSSLGTNVMTAGLTNTNGLLIQLTGGGNPTFRNKSIRMANGDLEILASDGSTTILRLQDSGNLTVPGVVTASTFTQTSDERKKEGWGALTDEQLSQLAGMKLVGTFNWRNSENRSVGGSAQEIRDIVPEAVQEDSEGGLSVNYGGLVFAIVQAMLARQYKNIG